MPVNLSLGINLGILNLKEDFSRKESCPNLFITVYLGSSDLDGNSTITAKPDSSRLVESSTTSPKSKGRKKSETLKDSFGGLKVKSHCPLLLLKSPVNKPVLPPYSPIMALTVISLTEGASLDFVLEAVQLKSVSFKLYQVSQPS
ncbi:hypothetical protein WICPIJ_002840 [Wickerhamomyces pijperi]|uniref:Uncharacterized protein n=1 Tax=Wickerhamomyces pijperi TaxID=599730 RepID=A0A9P8QAZ0_WICPI|nr:hypothetical protein WICPIJ_002840 [Wickerhamomyces pijperi]